MDEKRKYRKPVAWLGGRDLLANLKYFLLFAAFKGKLDPRDWMKPEIFPPNEDNPLAQIGVRIDLQDGKILVLFRMSANHRRAD